MSKDIAKLLSEWPHGEGPTARRIIGDDGREKIQIRVCVDTFHGFLQFECDGRPDGKRPHGREFYLDHLQEKRRRCVENGGVSADFRLTRSQCRKLFDEGGSIYHRYVVMLQLGDYERVMRDTERNMRLFRFINEHAARKEDREHLECWWPYILRIHHTAAVMEHLDRGKIDDALESIAACRQRIEQLPPLEHEVFTQEKERSLEALRQMEEQIRERRPLTKLEQLEKEKRSAISEQRFEEAARLRDRINGLRMESEPPPPETRG